MLLTLFTVFFLQQDTVKKDTVKVLNEVVINSVRADKLSPVSETTLHLKQLEVNYAGQELPAFIQKTPSTTWYSEGGNYNGYTYFRLRGIDQTRINFTMDGVPLAEPEDQGTYFSNYPDALNSMRSIQIQRGVGTSSYGNTSFGGSVNIETPSLTDPAKNEIQTTYGSYGTYRVSAESSTGLMKNGFSINTRITSLYSDGFRHNAFNNGQSVFVNGGYIKGKNIIKFVSFTGHSRNGMSYLAAPISELQQDYRTNDLTAAEKDDFHQSLSNIQFTRFVNSKLSYNVTGFYNYLQGHYGVLMPPDLYQFSVKSHFVGILGNVTYENKGLKLITGFNTNAYNRSHYMGVYPTQDANIYLNTGYKNEISVFQKVLYTINKLTIYGDLQYRTANFTYVQDKSTNLPFNPVTWTFLNPKIGATYLLTDSHTVYASLGRTSREPTRNDMFAGYDNIDTTNYKEVGNFTRVKPETVTDIEAGYKIAGQKIKFDGNIYLMYFQNEVAAIGQLSYIGLPLRKNVASSYRKGVELSLVALITNRLTSITNANFSHNIIKQYTTDYDGKTYNNVAPLLTPKAIINQSFAYKVKNWLTIDLGGKYISQSFLDNTNNSNFVTPRSLVFNGAINAKVYKGISFNFLVNNITDQKYYMSGYIQSNQSYYFPMATRNYLMTAKFVF